MNRNMQKIIAAALLAIAVTLVGCETLGIKKIPPGQIKKITKPITGK